MTFWARFIQEINQVLLSDIVTENSLKKLRKVMRYYLSFSQFKKECVQRILETVLMHPVRNWNTAPIFFNSELHYCIRILFWPAGYENPPHQHKTWSVTGVFYNQLQVNLYERQHTNLKKIHSINTSVNEVGYTAPHCIHSIKNPTNKIAASLHLFNYITNPGLENATWYSNLPSFKKEGKTLPLFQRGKTL